MTITKFHNVTSNFFYYFAFGSNLLQERIRVQNKGAEFEAIGVLKDFKLTFVEYGTRWHGGVASVLESPEEEQIHKKSIFYVWGCVWRVPNEFSDELDRQESGYHRLEVPISMGNTTVTCRTYQFSKLTAQYQPPSPHYKTVIVTGAEEHKLPTHYLKKLEAIPDNGFKGRVLVELKAIEHLQREN